MTQHGGRVLLVEDEDLIAMLTEDVLEFLGYVVAASVATLEKGLEAARTGEFDVAVLDVNLRGAKSCPIAEILASRAIPFIFATGYGAQGIEPSFLQYEVLQKPYSTEALRRILERVRGGR